MNNQGSQILAKPARVNSLVMKNRYKKFTEHTNILWAVKINWFRSI